MCLNRIASHIVLLVWGMIEYLYGGTEYDDDEEKKNLRADSK